MSAVRSRDYGWAYGPVLAASYLWGILGVILGFFSGAKYFGSGMCFQDAGCPGRVHESAQQFAFELAIVTIIWLLATSITVWRRPEDSMPKWVRVVGLVITAATFTLLTWPSLLGVDRGTVLLWLFVPLAPMFGSLVACHLRDHLNGCD